MIIAGCAEPEVPIILEESEDLTAWAEIAPLTATADGLLDYKGPAAKKQTVRFYRLRY